MTPPPKSTYIPALDGLRGLAILLVLLHHFTFYSGMKAEMFLDRLYYMTTMAGWCGVDLFFVLSGFLITGILVDAKGGPGYFRNFYMRRTLRIFPLYYAALALTFLLAPVVLAAGAEFSADQLWYWTYLINVKIALDGWPAQNAIAHFWSLAVEEQFYIVWPVLVLALSRRGLFSACAACIALALWTRVALTWADEDLAAYVLMPARMDSLALGALLALLAREPGGLQRWRRAAWGVAAVSGALLGWIFVAKRGLWLHHRQIHTVGFSIIALFFAALLTLTVTAREASLLHRLFTLRPMMMLGRYSYGLYVIHHPVAIGLGSLLGGWQLPTVLGSRLPVLLVFSAVCFVVSLLLAMLSWHLFESRFLRLKDRFATRPAGAGFTVSVGGRTGGKTSE